MMSQQEVGGVLVSDRTHARLRRYQEQLVHWSGALNLVGRSTLADAWLRHFADSAQLVLYAPEAVSHWADLGSGAGFPGLVVATILSERSPQTRVTLVESDLRKATFLRETARILELEVNVIAKRIESLAPLHADVVSARALAPLDRLYPLAAPHLTADGTGLFLKGANTDSELASVAATWSCSVERLRSLTDPSAEILRLKGLKHV
jgi:16S rRNA (guanine527-N7)-methyltransferase